MTRTLIATLAAAFATTTVLAPMSARADIYPGRGDSSNQFVKVSHQGKLLKFELCAIADSSACTPIGDKEWYTPAEIQARRNYLSVSRDTYFLLAVFSAGLALLPGAGYNDALHTLDPANLYAKKALLPFRTITEKDGKKTALGTMDGFSGTLGLALGDGRDPIAERRAAEAEAARQAKTVRAPATGAKHAGTPAPSQAPAQ